MGITDPTQEYFKDGGWGWDGSRWRKLAMVWGVTEQWTEDLGETKVGDGNFQQDTTAVPAGYIYVLQTAWVTNDSGARGRANIWLMGDVSFASMACDPTSVQYVPLLAKGPICLKAGDKVRLFMSTCLNNDAIKAGVWGYKMKVT